MSKQKFDRDVVRSVLEELGPQFRTKELSSHPSMLASHAELATHSHYHAFAGTYLSSEIDHADKVDDRNHAQGVLWRNRLSKAGSGTP